MAKDKKYGGRQAGTPNKTTASMKEAIAKLTKHYVDSGLMEQDLESIKKPQERLAIMEKFFQYTTPKMQAVAFTEADEKTKTIEEQLIELSKPKK